MNPALRILLAEPFPRAAAYRLYDTAGCHASSWRSCLLQITRCYECGAGRLLFSRCRVQRTRSYGYRPFPSAADMELPATSRLPNAANLELPAPARPRARRTRYRQLSSAANLELPEPACPPSAANLELPSASAADQELRPPAEADNSIFAALDADNSIYAALSEGATGRGNYLKERGGDVPGPTLA